MLSFHALNKDSKSIATITEGLGKGEHIYLTTENIDITPNELAKLKKENLITSKIPRGKEVIVDDGFVMFDIPDEPMRMFIAGTSGSGKSVLTGKISAAYKKKFPKNKIIIFSDVSEDVALEKLGAIRVELSSFVDNPLVPKIGDNNGDIENVLCIFDDIDGIQDKKIKKTIYDMRNTFLRMGRHANISLIITNHALAGGQETKTIIQECPYVVVFPKSTSIQNLQVLLSTYHNFKLSDINHLISLNTRWAMSCRNYPQYILWQSGAYIL